MRKLWVIAAREYMAAVRTKAFLIGLLVMPVLMFGGIVAQSVLRKQVDVKVKHFAIIDRTPKERIFPVLETAVKFRNNVGRFDPTTKDPTGPPFALERITPSGPGKEAMNRQRLELSERVRSGELLGFLEIGADVAQPRALPSTFAAAVAHNPPDDRHSVRYQTNRPTFIEFPRWAEKVVSIAVQLQRGLDGGLTLSAASGAVQPVPLVSRELTRRDPATGALQDAPEGNPANSFIAPMSLAIMMLMLLMVGTSPLMQSVMEEKMLRIAEVLLGSVRPFTLMAGKLVGIVGVSLTSVLIYLAGLYWAAHRFGYDEAFTYPVIGWFLLFQVLGVVMFGSLFAAIGAACTDGKEMQSLIMPVMLLATAPVFALGQIMRDPTSPLATGLSLFPFATPMLMTARLAIPPGIPLWQPLLGMVLVLLTTVACVFAAGRIFRVGLLLQGKGARLSDMARWVIRG